MGGLGHWWREPADRACMIECFGRSKVAEKALVLLRFGEKFAAKHATGTIASPGATVFPAIIDNLKVQSVPSLTGK